jgi:hypothetical protein
MGYVLTENRNGLVVQAELTQASGTAEQEAASAVISELDGTHPISLGLTKPMTRRTSWSRCGAWA